LIDWLIDWLTSDTATESRRVFLYCCDLSCLSQALCYLCIGIKRCNISCIHKSLHTHTHSIWNLKKTKMLLYFVLLPYYCIYIDALKPSVVSTKYSQWLEKKLHIFFDRKYLIYFFCSLYKKVSHMILLFSYNVVFRFMFFEILQLSCSMRFVIFLTGTANCHAIQLTAIIDASKKKTNLLLDMRGQYFFWISKASSLSVVLHPFFSFFLNERTKFIYYTLLFFVYTYTHTVL